MPFSIVITREGISDAVTAVPSNWVKDNNLLFWPKTRKKTEQENLRSNGDSMPGVNWKKQNCRVKVQNIATFEEALRQEEMYANFDDTDEEQILSVAKSETKEKVKSNSENEGKEEISDSKEKEVVLNNEKILASQSRASEEEVADVVESN